MSSASPPRPARDARRRQASARMPRRGRAQAFVGVLLMYALVGPAALACVNVDCTKSDGTCRPEALLPWLTSASACAVYAPARVSVSSSGAEGNAVADGGAISADGRYVVFASNATNLVTGDTNGFRDIFVHDRATRETTRVSVATGGIEATGGQSLNTDISDDGRYIAFLSEATNLVAGDTNGFRDAFVHDRITGVTTRVSVSTAGVQGDAAVTEVKISGDGRYVAFASPATTMVAGDTNALGDTFLHDRLTGETTRQSVTSGGAEGTGGTLSQAPGLSSDASLYVFSSGNTNLVAGDTNASADVFVRDRTASTTTRVSVATGGTEGTGGGAQGGTAISNDGRFVAFAADMTNLVAGDTNGIIDTFLHERATGITTRVSVASEGSQAVGPVGSSAPDISADGRYVAFTSDATNLVAGDTNAVNDVFVRDRLTLSTTRISLGLNDGAQGDAQSLLPAISANCPYVVFRSEATNLVPGDTNGVRDIFVVGLP